jgi:hypothetical protein
METSNRNITKCEMLLAIAMSELHQTTHVLFIPPNTDYTFMLRHLVGEKLLVGKSKSFYKVTELGWKYILSMQKSRHAAEDAKIDDFIKSL